MFAVVSNVIAFTRIYAAGRARWQTSPNGTSWAFRGAKGIYRQESDTAISAAVWGVYDAAVVN